MTQGNKFLNLIENICRSNIYLFIISRYIVGRYLSKFIFDADFKIIKLLNQKKYFKKSSLVIDIGANDGGAYSICRKFLPKKTKIVSFEPIYSNFKILEKFKRQDKFLKCFNVSVSNKLKKKNFYTPYFKEFSLTQFSGLDRKQIDSRLKKSLFIKNILKKIQYKKTIIETKTLDSFKLKPAFLKLDIEGHEYKCILGSLETIKKNAPIIMVEYDKKICDKIFKILLKYKYERFIYNKMKNKIEKFNNQEIMNISLLKKI